MKRGPIKIGGGVVLLAFVGLLLIQLVPYGRSHDNPPVVAEPNWDSPQTRELAQRACFDCHSNESVWPWYTSVAPMSWLAQRDVDEGRRVLNFSNWGRRGRAEEVGELREVILEGEMPPLQYTLIRGDARLSDAEKDQLIQGLRATIGQ